MDHLQRVHNPAHLLIQVPYSCSQPYDRHDFYAYPERRNFDLDAIFQATETIQDESFPWEEVSNLPAYVQEWLYFGLLHALFQLMQEPYVESDFLIDSDGETFVNTATLPTCLDRWRSRIRDLGPDTVETFIAIHRLLAFVNNKLRVLESSPFLEPELILSILILCTTVEQYLWRIFINFKGRPGPGQLKRYEYKPRGEVWRPIPILAERLRNAGWCPQEISMLRSDLSIPSMLYAGDLRRLRQPGRHESCTDNICLGNNIDESTYRTRHVEGGCPCANTCAGLSYTALCDAVARDQVPLVECHKSINGQYSFGITASALPQHYVAISHVWSHGLGNPSENQLPDCQLRRLHDLSCFQFADRRYSKFWIDTICIPSRSAESNLRRRAIGHMRDIYARAAAVLIMDEEFMQVDYQPLSWREVMLRFYSCDWSRRLWTLQEGLLNNNIWAKFRDGIVNISSTFGFHKTTMLGPMHDTAPTSLLDISRVFVHDRNLASAQQRSQIYSLLAYRSTSWAGDEPLCMAILMDVSIPQVLQGQTHSERMRLLYSLLLHVPVGMLFLMGPKLGTAGFRWAPSSLLGLGGPTRRDTAILSLLTTTRDQYGLHVQAPGYFLDMGTEPLPPRFFLMPHARNMTLDTISNDRDQLNVVRELSYDPAGHRSGTDMPSWEDISAEFPLSNPALVFGADRSDLNDGHPRAALLADVSSFGHRFLGRFVCLLDVKPVPQLRVNSPATSTGTAMQNADLPHGNTIYLKQRDRFSHWHVS